MRVEPGIRLRVLVDSRRPQPYQILGYYILGYQISVYQVFGWSTALAVHLKAAKLMGFSPEVLLAGNRENAPGF